MAEPIGHYHPLGRRSNSSSSSPLILGFNLPTATVLLKISLIMLVVCGIMPFVYWQPMTMPYYDDYGMITTDSARIHNGSTSNDVGKSGGGALTNVLSDNASTVSLLRQRKIGNMGKTIPTAADDVGSNDSKKEVKTMPSSSSSLPTTLVDTTLQSIIPQHVLDQNVALMDKARGYLANGDHPCVTNFGRVYYRIKCEDDHFKDLVVSLPLQDHDQKQQQVESTAVPSLLYHKFVGRYHEVKGMVHPQLAFPSKDDCVVYGMGIHDDSMFEQYMTKHCNQVHAFDCTVEMNSPVVKHKPFTFHQTCIGAQDTGIDVVSMYGNNQRALTFKPLHQIMDELGHTHIDLLKFDIEGSEWELFEQEILQLPPSKLPKQLLFELHTAKANPKFVPAKSVQGRDRSEVNKLMLRLFDVGYRIIEYERNDGDPYCTEVSMVRVTA